LEEGRAARHSPATLCAAQTGTSSAVDADPYIPFIEEWLATAPHLSAVDILVRLGKQAPDRFGEGQLRTAQRLVKKWRAEAAHQLINSAEAVIRIEPLAVPALAIPRSEPTQRLNLSQ
jgi:hypothetical protein